MNLFASELRDRKEIVKWGKELYTLGLVKGSGGNLSIRLEDGNIIFTPTGWFLGHMTEESISKTDPDGNLIDGPLPSKEVPLHIAAYHARPDIKAVAHTHSPYATALATILEVNSYAPVYVPSIAAKVGLVQVKGYAKPGSAVLGTMVSEAIVKSNGVMLSNHGIVAVGRDMQAAVSAAYEIETNAILHFISNGAARRLTDQEIGELI